MRALGPEPLGNEFDAAMLACACRGKRTSLKAALSDQKIVAGLGIGGAPGGDRDEACAQEGAAKIAARVNAHS